MKKLSLIIFFTLSATCLAQEKKKLENLVVDGAKLPQIEKYKRNQVRDVITEFNK